MERVLELRTDARLGLLDLVEQLAERRVRQNLPLARLHGNVPGHGFALVFLPLLDTDVAGVSMNGLLFPVQQRMRLGDIVDVGRRADHCMHDTRFGVHADVRLHAEVPLIAFLCLVHVRVLLLLLVLHRGRGGDDRRVDDRAFLEQQSHVRKVSVDGLEDGLGEIVLFHAPTEVEQCRRVGGRFAGKVDADKPADRLAADGRRRSRLNQWFSRNIGSVKIAE